jgi:hypothetical protein
MTVTPKMNLAVDSGSVSFNSSTNTEVQFDRQILTLQVKASANCYLGFDTAANTADALIEANDGWVYVDPCKITRLYVLGTGSGTLYYIATR